MKTKTAWDSISPQPCSEAAACNPSIWTVEREGPWHPSSKRSREFWRDGSAVKCLLTSAKEFCSSTHCSDSTDTWHPLLASESATHMHWHTHHISENKSFKKENLRKWKTRNDGEYVTLIHAWWDLCSHHGNQNRGSSKHLMTQVWLHAQRLYVNTPHKHWHIYIYCCTILRNGASLPIYPQMKS